MMGRNHLIANAALLPLSVWAYSTMVPPITSYAHTLPVGSTLITTPVTWLEHLFNLPLMVEPSQWLDEFHPTTLLLVIISFVCYIIGTLLPDCDSPQSLLGRYVHIPVRHRTWTHTIWFVLPLVALGWVWSPCAYMALGATFHIALDALSSAGVCWWYPLSHYRHIGNGIYMKKRHPIRLYTVGSRAETICVSVLVACGIGASILLIH